MSMVPANLPSLRSSQSAARLFTMAELLVTLAVASILMGLGTGIYKSIASGGLDGGARMLGKQLMLARQYAVTHRVNVAILLPEPTLSSSVPGTYQNSSLMAVEVTHAGGSVFVFKSLIDRVTWGFLPQRVKINAFTNNGMDVVSVPYPAGSGAGTMLMERET